MEDDRPALAGEIHIRNGWKASHVFDWQIVDSSRHSPSQHLVVRVRDDGQTFLSIRDEWSDGFDD